MNQDDKFYHRPKKITKAKWLKMKLTSVLYVLNLKKKSNIRVVVSTKGWKYRAGHK